MRSLIFAIFVLTFSFAKTQDKTIDSLKLALKNAKHDTTRCDILNAMIEAESDDAIWPKYNEQLKNLAEANLNKITPTHPFYSLFNKHLATSFNNIGFFNQNQGNIVKALEYYGKSLKIQEEIGDKEGTGNSLNNIGFIYKNQGDILKALEYYGKSLKIREEIGDKYGIANSLHNLGGIYDNQGDRLKALEYFEKSLKMFEEVGVKIGIASALNSLGRICEKSGDIPKALEYNFKSLKMREETGDKKGVAESLNNIGVIYKTHGDPTITSSKEDALRAGNTIALEYFGKSLKIFEEIGDKNGITYCLFNIGNVYLNQNQLSESSFYANKNLTLARELGFPDNIKRSASLLKDIYKKQNRFKEALEMYELEITMRDSINNEENKKASIKSQLKYEYEKKAAADSVKVVEEKKVVTAQLQQEKTQRFALYGGLGLVGLFALFMVNRFRVTSKQKKLIEEQKRIVEEQKDIVDQKQKEILDSIRYAKRIQTALITNEHYIKQQLTRLKA